MVCLIIFRKSCLKFLMNLGLAGIVTGTVIHSIKKYPETGKKTFVASCLSGTILRAWSIIIYIYIYIYIKCKLITLPVNSII